MAANFVSASKVVVLLTLCFVQVCKTAAAGPYHVCAYPQTCTDPGQNDPSHVVTATAQYNPTTKQCETIPSRQDLTTARSSRPSKTARRTA
ncbi:uncharacterized protein ISCGN_020574 [Ixodes scapularis]